MKRERASLDSNILVYAALEPDSPKGKRAIEIIKLTTPRGVLAIQALLEFVAVVRRRAPDLTEQAIRQAQAWENVFETAATTGLVAASAYPLIVKHKFQVWDAVIWSAARLAGATLFLSEDMQDGISLDGMRVRNPFGLSKAEMESLLGDGD